MMTTGLRPPMKAPIAIAKASSSRGRGYTDDAVIFPCETLNKVIGAVGHISYQIDARLSET